MPDQYDVPLMYRAQLEGRCQLHRIYKKDDLKAIAQEEGLIKAEQYSVRWVNQWLESQAEVENYPNSLLDDNLVEETTQFQTKEYTISWRFVTNGGKDDGIIRPLIAASGLPYYPGSSMKGAFREACQREEKAGRLPQGTCDRYCGGKLKDGDSQPGILRFHGGYPINQNWQKNLVDIVHPQPGWQVKTIYVTKKPDGESAFSLISLYQPELKFGISTAKPKETNWQQVWEIWEQALGYGIGCRVSCGYGLAEKVTGDVIYQVKLHGIGASSKLINQNSEFRPNIFRAALRGHALRIFGGLNQAQAEDIVDELFGGIRPGNEKVGLLGMTFHQENLHLDYVHQNDVYDVAGNLIWSLLGKLENSEHRPSLEKFVKKLTQFAMLLGGFGKSWRRADHRIFYPTYTKHIIGCHWKWADDNHPIKSLDEAAKLIKETIQAAKEWMEKRGFEVKQNIATKSLTTTPPPNQNKPNQPQLNQPIPKPVKKQNQTTQDIEWRESWYQENVQVWGRIAKNSGDSKVIHWLHSSKQGGNQQPQRGGYNQPKKGQNQSISSAMQRAPRPINEGSSRPSIYRTSLTGRLKDQRKSDDPTQIGRLWHRMYPLKNDQYLELITIFPKGCTEADLLIKWLASQAEWQKVW
jgi:CRISPR-associated protein Cmr6